MKSPITSCLWFNGKAAEAAAFHCKTFQNSEIIHSDEVVTHYNLNGYRFTALNGGPQYKMTPAVSYFVYCGSDNEIERLYKALKKGGQVLMPLGTYPWTSKYAWVQDKFGVSWQLDIDDIKVPQKIVPSLLFTDKKYTLIQEAFDHYDSIFESMFLTSLPYPISAGAPLGTHQFAQFKLNGTVFNAMSNNSKHDFDFTPGNSFVIECENQEEIDQCWDQLTDGGEASKCGWLVDKYGISWQVIPSQLDQLMSNPDTASAVMDKMLEMEKISIKTLEEAATLS